MFRLCAPLLFFNPLNAATTRGLTSVGDSGAHRGNNDGGSSSLASSAYVCMNHSVTQCAPFHLEDHYMRRGQSVYSTYQRKKNANNNLYQFVLEYDHQQRMGHEWEKGCCESHFFSRKPFSGSLVAAVATTMGVLLFAVTYGYNIAKPVIDAHHELWKPVAENAKENEEGEDDGKGPKEEDDDDV